MPPRRIAAGADVPTAANSALRRSVQAMRIIDFGPDAAREVPDHGSRGLRGLGAVRHDGFRVDVLHLSAGGQIGRHPAVGDQLFLVVSGRGEVCGEDGTWQPIAAGQAAVWSAGERHTTRADEPLVAVVVEAAALRLVR
jgi:quercetin dioxygenase-like cupin family protein